MVTPIFSVDMLFVELRHTDLVVLKFYTYYLLVRFDFIRLYQIYKR